MDSLILIQSLDEAIRIIMAARKPLAGGSLALWSLLDRAENHLDMQIKELLAPPVLTHFGDVRED
jgi:hypothetical protein